MGEPTWAMLLPAHRAAGDDLPTGRPRRVDGVDLGPGLRLEVYEDERGRAHPVPTVPGTVARARPGDGAAEALVAALRDGSRRVGSLELTSWHHRSTGGERPITVDQTNESVVVGDDAVVKWTVLADEGPHPGPSLLDALERAGFAGMPRPWGAVQWHPPDGSAARLVALVVDLLPGAVDGWSWLVDDLREAAASGRTTVAQEAGAAVGRLVAELHLALAGTARPATSDELAALRQSAVDDLARALAVTTGGAHDVLGARAASVRAALEAVPVDGTPLMRVHGDLHVGQVLRTGSGYALTDFDGNPVVDAASRSRVQPAAADVAGMAQSFTHAGIVVRKHHPHLDARAVDGTAAAARSALVDTYRRALADRAALLDERLLVPLALRQVCREFTYAATHLPRWSYVPEAALPMLLESGSS